MTEARHKMIDDECSQQIVRCDCGRYVGLSFIRKVTCACGRVLAVWSDYLSLRTKGQNTCEPASLAPLADSYSRPVAPFSEAGE